MQNLDKEKSRLYFQRIPNIVKHRLRVCFKESKIIGPISIVRLELAVLLLNFYPNLLMTTKKMRDLLNHFFLITMQDAMPPDSVILRELLLLLTTLQSVLIKVDLVLVLNNLLIMKLHRLLLMKY